jgi:hypothetical protein
MEPTKADDQPNLKVYWRRDEFSMVGNELLRRAYLISHLIQKRVRKLLEEEARQQAEKPNKGDNP